MDATSQTTFTGNTNLAGPEIALDGSQGGTPTSGLVINASNSVVRAMIINNCGFNGIHIGASVTTATGNVVEGCFIGTSADGTKLASNGLAGIQINNGSLNLIGGTATAARNIISGNFEGIVVTNST